MNRIKYWVVEPKETTITIDKDGLESIRFPYDAILAELVLPPDEVPEWPPPIRHGVQTKGWRVITRELPPSGLNDMTWVDWKNISTQLQEALHAVMESETDAPSAELYEKVGQAMDAYQIGFTEESMRVQGDPLPRDEERE